MKRLHIHLKTRDLDRSIAFYSALFGKAPDRAEHDYAKWLIDDPRAHVSVSTHHDGPEGIDHAGISIETREGLDETAGRLRDQGSSLFEEAGTTCCYAQSNKFWAKSPEGATWELFQTFGDSAVYGAEPDRNMAPAANPQSSAACCAG